MRSKINITFINIIIIGKSNFSINRRFINNTTTISYCFSTFFFRLNNFSIFSFYFCFKKIINNRNIRIFKYKSTFSYIIFKFIRNPLFLRSSRKLNITINIKSNSSFYCVRINISPKNNIYFIKQFIYWYISIFLRIPILINITFII